MPIRIKRKFSAVLVACTLAAIAPATDVGATPKAVVVPMFGGATMDTTQPDGQCMTNQRAIDRLHRLKTVERLAQTVRTLTTSDCNALMNLIPAAMATGLKINVTVWAVDTAKFDTEKRHLEDALKSFGADWLNTVSVGSESLYQKEIDPNLLAERILDVKGMVHDAYGHRDVAVGTSEPRTVWADSASDPVVEASDFVGLTVFPYWEGKPVDEGVTTLKKAIRETRAATSGKPLVVTETGWPSAGPAFGEAVASLESLERYFNEAVLWLLQQKIPYNWFSGWDEPGRFSEVEKHFGVFLADGTAKFQLTR
ncbi:glycosyl hydrolase family 17 protein [Lentzea sp. NPDC051213]|uniref:glycosyl hydrolase family 17 protein n=1 Tax=Lentzea sp. NPDC051213 TaxID=3364126 RepID=UPI0037B3D039